MSGFFSTLHLFRVDGTIGAGGACAPPVFLGERPKNHVEIAHSVAPIHSAPPDFSTLLGPAFKNVSDESGFMPQMQMSKLRFFLRNKLNFSKYVCKQNAFFVLFKRP